MSSDFEKRNYLDEDEKPIDEWTVEEAAREFADANRDLEQWEQEFEPLLLPLRAAQERFGKANVRLAQVMANNRRERLITPDGAFEIKCTKQNRGRYDPEKLPKNVLELPGVTEIKVSTKKIQEAMEYGLIEPDEVRDAWVPQESKPYLSSVKARDPKGGAYGRD